MAFVDVILRAKNAGLRTGLEKAKQDVDRFAKNSVRLLGGIASAAAVKKAVSTAFTFANTIANVSDKLGVGTGFLQRFNFAAEQTGTTADKANLGLQRFTRRLAQAAKGEGELLATLRENNIAVRDQAGRVRDAEEVIFDLADAIKAAATEEEKLLIAFKAFDSEGADLVRTLGGGADALRAFFDQADRAGAVLEDQVIRRFKEADSVIKQFGRTLTVNAARTVDFLTPGGILPRSGDDLAVGRAAMAERAREIRGQLEELQRGVDSGTSFESAVRRDGLRQRIRSLRAELAGLGEVEAAAGRGDEAAEAKAAEEERTRRAAVSRKVDEFLAKGRRANATALLEGEEKLAALEKERVELAAKAARLADDSKARLDAAKELLRVEGQIAQVRKGRTTTAAEFLADVGGDLAALDRRERDAGGGADASTLRRIGGGGRVAPAAATAVPRQQLDVSRDQLGELRGLREDVRRLREGSGPRFL